MTTTEVPRTRTVEASGGLFAPPRPAGPELAAAPPPIDHLVPTEVPDLYEVLQRGGSKYSALPLPPTDEEKYSWVDREMVLLVVFSCVSMVCLTVSQIHFVLISPALAVFVPFLLLTLVYFVISLWINVGTRNFDVNAHRRLVQDWTPAVYPSVDILLPICNEEMAVLCNTWRHVAEMASTYPGDVTVYVLDDGASESAEQAAAAFGFEYHVRENRGWFKKAGNLRAGFDISSSTYLAIFDADFAPRADFLTETVPYLDGDPSIGILQTPQFFRATREQTLVERGAGSVQELFYRLVQVSRDRYGAAICVGSCAVYRREALAETGGAALVEHSEDVHTGFEITDRGWRLKYIPIPLSTGLCPPDPDSFLTQQYRWCAGSMNLMRSGKFWRSRLPWSNRMCYVSGFVHYIQTAVFAFIAPVIPIVLLVFLPEQVRLVNYLWILPSMLYAFVVFPLWNRGRYGLTGTMAKLLYSWVHAFAIWDGLRNREMEWQVTGAGSAKTNLHRIWLLMGVWMGSTSLLWIGGAGFRVVTMSARNFVFLLLTGVIYAVVATTALVARRQSAARTQPSR